MVVCKGITLKGIQCKRLVKNGEYCCSHIPPLSENKKKEKKVVEKHERPVIADDEPIDGRYYCWRHVKTPKGSEYQVTDIAN